MLSFRCRKGDRLLANALHQTTVTAKDVGAVVNNTRAVLRCHNALGDGHADSNSQALAKWTGGGLNAAGMTIFRMSWITAKTPTDGRQERTDRWPLPFAHAADFGPPRQHRSAVAY